MKFFVIFFNIFLSKNFTTVTPTLPKGIMIWTNMLIRYLRALSHRFQLISQNYRYFTLYIPAKKCAPTPIVTPPFSQGSSFKQTWFQTSWEWFHIGFKVGCLFYSVGQSLIESFRQAMVISTGWINWNCGPFQIKKCYCNIYLILN